MAICCPVNAFMRLDLPAFLFPKKAIWVLSPDGVSFICAITASLCCFYPPYTAAFFHKKALIHYNAFVIIN